MFQLNEVTERLFGIGARGIALFDAAAVSPLDQLGMIPLLTLVAIYAPASHRATWFALMASLMNLALTAGALGTKYLNLIFHVDRGELRQSAGARGDGVRRVPGAAAQCHRAVRTARAVTRL